MKESLMSENGRTVIPQQIRNYLGLQTGDTLVWVQEAGAVYVTSRAQQLRKAQMLFQSLPHAPATSAVEEILAERRQEAAT